MLELRRELGHGAEEHALQRRDLLLVAVGLALFPLLAGRAVVHHPVDAERRVELGPEAGGEEAVAEQAPRGVEDEDVELGFRDGEAVRPRRLGVEADHQVEVLDVVDQAAVGMAEAIVDRRAVVVELRRGDHLRRIADVLAVDGAELVDQRALVFRLVGIGREPDVDEVLEAGELLEAELPAELVEARHAVLAVADDVERGEIDGGVESGGGGRGSGGTADGCEGGAGRAAGVPWSAPSWRGRPPPWPWSPCRGTCRRSARGGRWRWRRQRRGTRACRAGARGAGRPR